MSTITEILNTDSPSSSIGAINTNFENLNTDKIEATQTVALTNKTIDADLNTITDLTPTNIKSGNKTGADTFIVTGTKGDVDEIAKWNTDGDLVSSDVTITTTAPTVSSTDTTLPTSQAVYEAITANLDTKQIFVQALYNDVSVTNIPYGASIGNFPYANVNSGNSIYFNFSVPANFNSLTSAELVMIPDATETITISQCSVDSIANGELYTANTVSTGSFSQAVTVSLMTKVRLDTRTNTPFVAMAADDIVGVKITSGTTLFRVIGLLIKYT